MKGMVEALNRLRERLFGHRHKWVYRERVSRDRKTLYFLRTCSLCDAEEISNRFGVWNDLKTARFSSVPQFEEYHRKRFEESDDVDMGQYR